MATFNTLSDDFEDGTRAAVWSGTYGTVTESGGRTQIASNTGWNALSSGYSYSLLESSVHVEVFPAAGTGNTGEAWSNMQVSGSLNSTRLVIEQQASSGNVRIGSDVDWWDANATTIPYDPVAHRWWRIRETGGTVYFETAPDGSTWTARKTIATPSWVTSGADALRVHFESHQDAGESVYEIDRVNVTPGPATPTNLTASAATNITYGVPAVPEGTDKGLVLVTASTRATTGVPTSFSWADTVGGNTTEVTDLTANDLVTQASWTRQGWTRAGDGAGPWNAVVTRSTNESRPGLTTTIIFPHS